MKDKDAERFKWLVFYISEGREIHDQYMGMLDMMNQTQRYYDGGKVRGCALTMKLISLVSSDRLGDMIEDGEI